MDNRSATIGDLNFTPRKHHPHGHQKNDQSAEHGVIRDGHSTGPDKAAGKSSRSPHEMAPKGSSPRRAVPDSKASGNDAVPVPIVSTPKRFPRHGRRRDERCHSAVVVGHAASMPRAGGIKDAVRQIGFVAG
jgi:hypothetical protein